MPNIVGIWRPDSSSETIEKTLGQQLAVVRTNVTSYDEYAHVSRGFGMANQTHGIFDTGPQPVYSSDGSRALILDGELSNAQELQEKYRNSLPRENLSSAELCFELLDQFGASILADFFGAFIIAQYDSSSQTLTLISDRLGFRPLFFVDHGHEFIFATELKGIVAAEQKTPTISALGLLELFSYKTHVFGRTWIEGYKRLAPATIMKIGPSRRSAESYWTYRYNESAPPLGQETYYTVYAKLLDRSVHRAMSGNQRIGIFLSGGYDSRCIAAAIRPQHAPIPAFTFGDEDSRDVIYGKMIAERLGFRHTTISRQGAYLFPNAPSIAWRTEGMVPFANTTSIDHHSALKDEMDIILAGFLGEFSGSHVWLKLLLSRSRSDAISTMFDRFVKSRSASVRRVFNVSFYNRYLQELKSEFYGSFDAIDNDHPHNVSDVWNFRYFHPQETYHAPAIDRHLFEVRTPLTDPDLVSFLLTIPPMARLEQRVYKKMIAYSYPQVRDIPCTNSGRPIDPHFAREYARMAANRSSRFFAKVVGLGSQDSKRDFRNLADDFRAEPELVTELLLPMIQEEVFPANIFNIAGIETIIDEHFNHNARHEILLSSLIGWGLAAKQLLRGDRESVPASLRGRA